MKRNRVFKSKLGLMKGSSKVMKNLRKEAEVDHSVEEACPYSLHEKVLCFEPDPLKCKVLYEAKILRITSSVDSAGNTEFQYLVHFQGWNSSWDRFVADDLIMKDSEETRKLQDELNVLAATQQLKKGKQKTVPKPTNLGAGSPVKRTHNVTHKRRIHKNRCRDSDLHFIQLEDLEGSDGGGGGGEEFNVQITLPQHFTNLLEMDYDCVHRQNLLPRLPAPISVAEIIERFVKLASFAKLERWHKKFKWGLAAPRPVNVTGTASTSAQTSPPITGHFGAEGKIPDELLKILNEVEIMKQLATDITLMFDCYVEHILIYAAEKGRYQQCLKNKTTIHKPTKIEIPEGLRLLELNEKDKTRMMRKIGLGIVAKQRKKIQTVTASSASSESELRESSTDSEGVSVENHCKHRITKFVKELVSWSLADWGTDARPSLIYGLPHLLRLLVKIPEVLVKSDLERTRMYQVSIFLNRLLSFIVTEFKEDHMCYDHVPQKTALENSKH